MFSNQITGASFLLTPLTENAYDFTIAFAEASHTSSHKTFTFLQSSNTQEGSLFDVLTKNAKSNQASVKNLFKKNEIAEANAAANQLRSVSNTQKATIAVFDFKEPHQQYLPCALCDQTIAKAEEVVCEFYKQPHPSPQASSTVKKLHTLFHDTLPIDYVLCEGSLKQDLLKYGGFTEEQIAFLNAPKGPGALSFCQCAEFFMNAFKLGQSALVNHSEFLAEKYIKPVSTKFEAFKPYAVSTVYYPALYKEIYSPEGPFAQTLKPLFLVNGDFNEANNITTLCVEKKNEISSS